jgi:replication factor A1
LIDVIGVLKELGDISEITSKTTQKPYSKRELTLVDNSGYSVRLTVWGNTASSFEVPVDSIIAFKGCKVSDFGGRSLSLLSSGSMAIDPDIEAAHKLKGWYDAQGRNDTFTSHASLAGSGMGGMDRPDSYKTIGQVKDENIGTGDSPEYFTLKATVIFIKKETFSYRACPTPECNKKVADLETGQWRCERCNKTFSDPPHRYMFSCQVLDHSGQIWLSCFDDVGKIILGQSATELFELKQSNQQAFDKVFNDALCKKWNFRCRAKMDTYQDQHK